jgi:hypothetical protein
MANLGRAFPATYDSTRHSTLAFPNRYSLVVGAFATALLLFAFLLVYRIFLHPLSHIPGPFAARTTELWRTSRYFRGTWHKDILELHRRYGPVVRVSPNEVSVVDADALTTVWGFSKPAVKVSSLLP